MVLQQPDRMLQHATAREAGCRGQRLLLLHPRSMQQQQPHRVQRQQPHRVKRQQPHRMPQPRPD